MTGLSPDLTERQSDSNHYRNGKRPHISGYESALQRSSEADSQSPTV